jgi:CRISPR/Cas system-associated endonuclease Cas1
VREFVINPAGRARGYTAMDAAINYLHQRRLFKARSTNVQLGLDVNPGEGFLHRKRWNPEGLGLILDLIDPFKFADREKLLGAVKDVSVNWRDFYSSTDRYGARYYYPKEEAVGVLEALSEEADKTSVSYQGAQITLAEAYQDTVDALIQNLQASTPLSFTPFVY